MNPRIFISSTFYDLKYARENLGDFINNYGFESIQSESGDIGYSPGEDLDKSCYSAMTNADMAIVIIGGRYGSPTSDSETINESFDKYISVTHREFDTAIKNNVPLFVFIEKAVNHEFQLYNKNKEKFENGTCTIKFVAVDNINVHRFINDIKRFPKIPIFEFDEIGDIKEILRKQWASMFNEYLYSKKHIKPIEKIQPSIDDIYSTLKKMDLMLEQVGKNTLGSNSDEYISVVCEQEIENAAAKISNAFEFISTLKDRESIKQFFKFFIDKLFYAYDNNILEYYFSTNSADIDKFYSVFEYDQVLISSLNDHIYFETDIFSKNDCEYKNSIVNRLVKNDYLKKMGFSLENDN